MTKKVHLIVFLAFLFGFGFIQKSGSSYVFLSDEPADTLAKGAETYLKIDGIFKELKDPKSVLFEKLDSVTVEVFNDKQLKVTEFLVRKKNVFTFKLPLQKKFTVKVSKAGLTSKIVEISTIVPLKEIKIFYFRFEISLFKVVQGLNVSLLKEPIAKITYHIVKKEFDYDSYYTSKINKELIELYKEYYKLKEEEEAREKAEADSIMLNGAKPKHD